ncbi:MAG TPA: histidine kinase [Xanthomonadales bacterium]|nr:histidine kinase [Xanthomonadales bacterium]
MAPSLEKELQSEAGGVYPPSFCSWRLMLVVMLITELAVVLIGMGAHGFPGWGWLGVTTIYAQWLALFCTSGLCITSGWTGRLSSRGAWVGNWLISLALVLAFSYAAWHAAPVVGIELEGPTAAPFVVKSMFVVGLVSLAMFRYLLIRTRWRAELMAQADARVQALQARIQPHFLFNSLNTIASLVHSDPKNAEAATLDLADIFRGSMRRADQAISLAEELGLARQYLDMELRRLGDRLEVSWRVDELPERAAVLPLMLQPLLENAVAHGIQSATNGGTIVVYGRGEGDQVVVTIANSVAAGGSHTKGHGMALENIRERLRLAFGSRASLLTYDSDQMFYAVLSLPYVEMKPAGRS